MADRFRRSIAGQHLHRQATQKTQLDPNHLPSESEVRVKAKGLGDRLHRHQDSDESGSGPLGENAEDAVDIFDDDYLEKLKKIKLPNTKIKLLQQLLARAIEEFKKVNRNKGIDFSKKFQAIVDCYNERNEDTEYVGEVYEDITNEIVDLIRALGTEQGSFADLGIDLEEKAFYDILKELAIKYDFTYPEDKLIELAKAVKVIVDDKAKYTDWSQRGDIKAELKVDLILVLADHGYPPVDRDEVYKEIYEQAENFKKHRPAQ